MTDAWPFAPLIPGGYGAILCDPPWAFATRSAKGLGKSPEAHYPTMDLAALADLPVARLAAPDCLMFMWATWPHLRTALALIDAWGFAYKTGGAWVKRTSGGGPAFGTGYLLRSATEPFLIATRGAPRVGSRSVRNLIDGLRREHSRKPPEARAMVEALRPGVAACELFAREPWPGQSVWGNDTGRFAATGPEIGPLAAMIDPDDPLPAPNTEGRSPANSRGAAR